MKTTYFSPGILRALPKLRHAAWRSDYGWQNHFALHDLVISLLAMFFIWPIDLLAQTVPALVNYQGRLANPDGSPLPTGDYELRLRVYDAANGGNLIWGPQLFDAGVGAGHGPKIPVVQGYFNAMLGPVDILSNSLAGAFTATNRFVEVSVGANNPILPRQQILSAPFALQAENSAKLAGADWSAVFGTNDPVNGKIAGFKIADATVTFTNLAPRPVGANVSARGGVGLSPDLVDDQTTSSVFIPVANCSVTITTAGRPVLVTLVAGQPAADGGYFRLNKDTSNGVTLDLRVVRNATSVLGTARMGVSTEYPLGGLVGSPGLLFIDPSPPSGTSVYQLQWRQVGGAHVFAYAVRLAVFEL